MEESSSPTRSSHNSSPYKAPTTSSSSYAHHPTRNGAHHSPSPTHDSVDDLISNNSENRSKQSTIDSLSIEDATYHAEADNTFEHVLDQTTNNTSTKPPGCSHQNFLESSECLTDDDNISNNSIGASPRRTSQQSTPNLSSK